jgi:hypothetical protein
LPGQLSSELREIVEVLEASREPGPTPHVTPLARR